MVWPEGHPLQSGKYIIEKELKKGGFGITYLAKNAEGKQRAIKTLKDTWQKLAEDQPEVFARFQEELVREALRAKCNHPHIVRIYDAFQEHGLWCMVMEYIEGEDLVSYLKNQGVLPEAEALQYIQQIGEALTFVHNNNVLHRDVKPNNIMVRAGTSEAVLIDFGIAREFTHDVTQTYTNAVSAGFSPIEQYSWPTTLSTESDVYALAATLYYLLTGKVPKDAQARAKGEPLVEPKDYNPKISDLVNQAILKGMMLERTERSQTVPQWFKELGLGSIPTKTQQSVSNTPKTQQSVSNTPKTQQSVSIPTKTLKPGSIPKTIPSPKQPHRRQWGASIAVGSAVAAILFGLTWQLSSPKTSALINTLTGYSSDVNSVAFSPNGQTLASGSRYDETIKLWNVPTGELKTTLTSVLSVAFSPDGQTLASGNFDHTIKLWNVPNGELKTTLNLPTESTYILPPPPLSAASDDRLPDLVIPGVALLGSNPVAFSPDGQTLASGSGDNTIKLWNVSTGKIEKTLTGHSSSVNSVAFSPDGQTLASGSYDKTIKLWNVPTGELKTTLTGHSDPVYSVAFSPDGQTLASGSSDNTIKLWNVPTGELKTTLTGHSSSVNSVAFSPDGQTLASGSGDKTIKLWNVPTGELKTTLTGHSEWVHSVAFSPDGQTLASGSNDKTIKIWRVSP